MWHAYVAFVKGNPLLSSALQVALLGTFGELLACRMRGLGWNPFRLPQLLAKVAVWAFLGITFKVAFAGFAGFVPALWERGLWMSFGEQAVWRAFSISLFCNLLFGPVMMAFHRWTDCRIERRPMAWETLYGAWWTLLWFWIPAHTVTFSLPPHFQVGLAAVWAVALGVILGFFARKAEAGHRVGAGRP